MACCVVTADQLRADCGGAAAPSAGQRLQRLLMPTRGEHHRAELEPIENRRNLQRRRTATCLTNLSGADRRSVNQRSEFSTAVPLTTTQVASLTSWPERSTAACCGAGKSSPSPLRDGRITSNANASAWSSSPCRLPGPQKACCWTPVCEQTRRWLAPGADQLDCYGDVRYGTAAN